MKKILLPMLTVVSMMAVSCGNDDDAPANLANDVAANYIGYTNASTAYFNGMITENQTVTVTANPNGTANVTFDSETWGKTLINNANVTTSDGVYIISGTGISEIAGHGGTKSYDCSLEGKVGKNKENVTFRFSIPSVMGGLTIDFVQGQAPAALIAAGTYQGYTSTSTAYFKNMITADESLKIEATNDGKVSINYKSSTWGETTIIANAEREGSDIKLSGKGTLEMPGMNGGETKKYDCSVGGLIAASKESVKITFSVPSVMGGTTIEFQLGDAPATE